MMIYLSDMATHLSEFSFSIKQILTECNIASLINKSTQECKLTNFYLVYNLSCSRKKVKLHSQTFNVFGFYIHIKMFASALRWTFWEVQVYRKSDYFMASVIPRKKTQELMWNDRKHHYLILSFSREKMRVHFWVVIWVGCFFQNIKWTNSQWDIWGRK